MRKTADITIQADGRDKTKTYRLTEMDAIKAEKWAIRCIMAMGKGGVTIPEELPRSMAGIALLGLGALLKMNYEDAEPLLDEMFACVQIVTSSGAVRPATFDGDIEEVATRFQLRKEVFELHTGFFERAARLKSTAEAAAATASDTPSA
jgi:hypothetical protein